MGSPVPTHGRPRTRVLVLRSRRAPAHRRVRPPRVRRGGFDTREAAHAALTELRRPDARADATTSISTGACLRACLASRISLAPLTEHGYRTHVRLYLEPTLGHIPLTEL